MTYLHQLPVKFRAGFSLFLLVFLGSFLSSHAQVNGRIVQYNILPKTYDYSPDIPTPYSYLGYQVGKWHVDHHALVSYLQVLADASDRIQYEQYAKTIEDRPMVLLTVSSPQNLAKLDDLRKAHLELSDPAKSSKLEVEQMPAVVYQGFTVHGNEPSGAQAAILLAYHLAAAQDQEVVAQLNEMIILIDPCLNPDGYQRHTTWVNANQSQNPHGDVNDREHNEAWPGGRTNHYWFDLNRDWLPAQFPESSGRLKIFHKWKPNVVTDHHEMGAHNTFFFQPGVTSRVNPNTPTKNQELTANLGKYHARALDAQNQLYFTKETFDDFYYGKGSTYPDVNGGVGILFEQASSRGVKKHTAHGLLTFEEGIRNQLTTALSTLEGAQKKRTDLLNYQREFFSKAISDARQQELKAFVIDETEDPARVYHFIKMILSHDIEVFKAKRDIQADGETFPRESSYIIPLEQKQYRLIKSAFETRTNFEDSIFYDISAWTLPLAFNLDYASLNRSTYRSDMLGARVTKAKFPEGGIKNADSEVGYVVEWNHYYAPKLAYHMLGRGYRIRVATKAFSINTNQGTKNFKPGALILAFSDQDASRGPGLTSALGYISKQTGIPVFSIASGLSESGADPGSPSFKMVQKPSILMLSGDGVSAYDAGAIWRLLDHHYYIPFTFTDRSKITSLNLSHYNTIIFPHGSYRGLNKVLTTKLQTWVREGGTLILIGNAIKWGQLNNLAGVAFPATVEKERPAPKPYGTLQQDLGAQNIGGIILEANIDLTHPLGFGFPSPFLPVFRNNELTINPPKNPYATPLIYTQEPLIAGYVSKENQKKLVSSPAIVVGKMRQGRVICMIDPPAFRGFWYGTTHLLMNAIFFSPIIDGDAAENF